MALDDTAPMTPETLPNEPAAADDTSMTRKDFLGLAGRGVALGVAAAASAGAARAGGAAPAAPAASGAPRASGGGAAPRAVSPPAQVPAGVDQPIVLEAWKSEVDPKSPPTPTPLPPDQRVGFALVGLGHLTLEELLPAFGSCRLARPTALVSGSPEKLRKVAAQYGIRPEHCYSYEDYDKLRDNAQVQAIYIVLPNALHAEYTVRGARAGKHILCEKPMANSVRECEQMIEACRAARVKLMIAYRIQYEPHNRLVREWVRAERFGPVKYLQAQNSQSSANPDHWRHRRALAGGGALPDIGLYCLNTARYLLGTEPVEVFATQHSTPGEPLFREVEELMAWQMRFPGGIVVDSITHYDTLDSRFYRVNAKRGWVHLDNAYAYRGQALRAARTVDGRKEVTDVAVGAINQFAAEMDHFADCIRRDVAPHTPGEEGLQDQRVMEAIYQSAREHRPIALTPIAGIDVFRGPAPKPWP